MGFCSAHPVRPLGFQAKTALNPTVFSRKSLLIGIFRWQMRELSRF